jgi:hypothetical protein
VDPRTRGRGLRRWVDLDELRRDIAADAKARALAVGLERVSVRVTIAAPDRRGRREVVIDVDHAEPGLVRV